MSSRGFDRSAVPGSLSSNQKARSESPAGVAVSTFARAVPKQMRVKTIARILLSMVKPISTKSWTHGLASERWTKPDNKKTFQQQP